ncbi:MAG: twitching motility protein PilT [Planctomycetaceae bacterium]|nr:twitching motility protein PilT [Planctomycetaceae bacterium]
MATSKEVEHAMDDMPISTSRTAHFEDSPLRKYFEMAIKHEATDLHVKPDAKPKLRIRTELKSIEAEPFTTEAFEKIIESFLNEAHYAHFQSHGYIDMAYDFDERNRFRVNVFRARGKIGLAARRIGDKILSYEQLMLPPVLAQIAEKKQGLVLMAGITGSGKSTTIASMIQQVNEQRPCHIITLEDPIEFLFEDAKAIVSQREIGVDVHSWAEALRSMVREDPDVVLVGEMRDHDTFEAGLHAAETGHLVFGTVHASSAPQVFARIYDLFEESERDPIRNMLAFNLNAVIYQQLLATLRDDVGRVPAVEILINNTIVSRYILEGRDGELSEVIRSAPHEGMVDFNTCLVELVQKEYIRPQMAIDASHNPDELRMLLKGFRTSSG